MKALKKEDISQEIFDLYDDYAHNKMDRKEFLQKYKSTLMDHELNELKETNKLLQRDQVSIEKAKSSLQRFQTQNPTQFIEWTEKMTKKLK